MSKIAEENNQRNSFLFSSHGDYEICWFTPVEEVDLCGHATLAAAWVLFNKEGVDGPLKFKSRSGELTVSLKDESDGGKGIISLNFPAGSHGE